MLRLEDVSVDIAGASVLRGVTMSVPPGERVALIGRNGAGKTTTLRSLMGLLPLRGGRISLDGQDCAAVPAHHRARLGIGYAPEERRLFGNFTVRENMLLPAEVLGLPSGQLAVGAVADVCVFDLEETWQLTSEALESRGKNSPWIGYPMTGKVRTTLVGGRVVFQGA